MEQKGIEFYVNRGHKPQDGAKGFFILGRNYDFDIKHFIVHNKKCWNYTTNGFNGWTINWLIEGHKFATLNLYFADDHLTIYPSLADDEYSMKDFVDNILKFFKNPIIIDGTPPITEEGYLDYDKIEKMEEAQKAVPSPPQPKSAGVSEGDK